MLTHFMPLVSFCTPLFSTINHVIKMINQFNIYLFKVNNRNTRKRCEIWSKLTIKTPERPHWRRSGVFIVNFEHIWYLLLEFLLLNLSKLMLTGWLLHESANVFIRIVAQYKIGTYSWFWTLEESEIHPWKKILYGFF